MQKSILDKKEREKERERAKEAGEIGSDWVHALRAKDYFIDCPIRSEGQAIYRIETDIINMNCWIRIFLLI